MSRIEAKLAALGLVLPEPIQMPPGFVAPFQFVRVVATRAYISGHCPLTADGMAELPFNIPVEIEAEVEIAA